MQSRQMEWQLLLSSWMNVSSVLMDEEGVLPLPLAHTKNSKSTMNVQIKRS
jgi:hypothetical protein